MDKMIRPDKYNYQNSMPLRRAATKLERARLMALEVGWELPLMYGQEGADELYRLLGEAERILDRAGYLVAKMVAYWAEIESRAREDEEKKGGRR